MKSLNPLFTKRIVNIHHRFLSWKLSFTNARRSAAEAELTHSRGSLLRWPNPTHRGSVLVATFSAGSKNILNKYNQQIYRIKVKDNQYLIDNDDCRPGGTDCPDNQGNQGNHGLVAQIRAIRLLAYGLVAASWWASDQSLMVYLYAC